MALKSARVTKPVTFDPEAPVGEAGLRRHVARGAELSQRGQYAEAEKEFRAAAELQPENPDTHYALGNILYRRQKLVDAQGEFSEAMRLRPDFALAHRAMGVVAESLGDEQNAFREYQKAYILDLGVCRR